MAIGAADRDFADDTGFRVAEPFDEERNADAAFSDATFACAVGSVAGRGWDHQTLFHVKQSLGDLVVLDRRRPERDHDGFGGPGFPDLGGREI